MGSRAEGGPRTVFDWFFEAACPVSLQDDPPILRQFPPDFRDQDAMRMVPKFCFPFDMESHLPWFELFYKILNIVGDLLAQDQVPEAEELLLNLQQRPPSGARDSVGLELLSCFVAPDSDCLPSIPENRNLTELVVAITDENILGLFAALLAERRVLLTARKLSTLTSCVHASCALLYPMRWEHVLIPTLPPHLLDYCCAPMPYLIGVHASLAERVLDKALEDVVVMDVDSNTLQTPFDDVQALPPDVVSLLRLRLRKVSLSPGEGVSRLFLKAQALLFGGYRDALICSPGQPVTFNEEAFLAQKPGAPLQAFHRRAVHLQLFKQFIEARLEKLNTGQGFSDQFEQEITCCGASSGTLRSYQIWADNLKKGGGALLHSVRSKTQPAVRNMYRSAKSGLKGVQSLLTYKVSGRHSHRLQEEEKDVASSSGVHLLGWGFWPAERGFPENPTPPQPFQPSATAAPACHPTLQTSKDDTTPPPLPKPHSANTLLLFSAQHPQPSFRKSQPPPDSPFPISPPYPCPQSLPLDPGGFQMAEEPLGPLGDRMSPLGLKDPQGPWIEETLDSSFLESGEELDLLSEIFDSLSVETKMAGSLRPSQSLHCWRRGNSDSCFSLPNLPGGWQHEEKGPPEPQPRSLPMDLAPLSNTLISDSTRSQVPSENNQKATSTVQPSTASAAPECSAVPEHSRAQGNPHSWRPTAPTQPHPLESPQTLAHTKPNSGPIWRSQSLDSSDLSFLESPRAQPLHCSLAPQDPGASSFLACPTKKKQEPQARRQTRIAGLKKCLES
ncbi:DENN domain-containing protein 1C isoform X2 [Perognathus longimembris pacificus]|uniref:DENN domain-containing protein 1C isoform X2 n=1 Tax=Perognathus longimembris pacificus TaxID=214514 RepID=UPI0020197111|nr:DENN domain-containing protein 1C isoform X2 [Perognathus longimembris pacificus]